MHLMAMKLDLVPRSSSLASVMMRLIVVGFYVGGCFAAFDPFGIIPNMGGGTAAGDGGIVRKVVHNAAQAANGAITTGTKVIASPQMITNFLNGYKGLMGVTNDPEVLEASALAFALGVAAERKQKEGKTDKAKEVRKNLSFSPVSCTLYYNYYIF